MPVLNSLLDHKVLGREFNKGLAQGLEQGREEGRNKGEATLLRRLLEHRFQKLPKWVDRKLATTTPTELEEWGDRLVEKKSLAAIFDPGLACHCC